jgi:predicted CopG family antitoxin
MQTISIKDEAMNLVSSLNEKDSWDDLMYKIYVRQTIESGLADSQANKTLDVKDVRKMFGLSL